MNHFAVRRAGVLLAKAAFLLFGLAAIWMMLSLVEPDGIYPWWLVTLASVGVHVRGMLLFAWGTDL